MLTFDQAKQCILQQIPPCTNSNPMEEWIIDDKRCCEYPDYWYIWGNARGFVEYGDTSYLLVGSNGYLVDKFSHEIIALSNRFSPEQYIQDRQNERAAAGKHYVLRYVQPENPHARKTELLKLKHLFSFNYAKISQLQNQSEWLSTRLFTLQNIQNELAKHGITTKIILCDELAAHVIVWQYDCGEHDYLKLSHFIKDIQKQCFQAA